MAKECRQLVRAISDGYLGSSTDVDNLNCVALFLSILEKRYPENVISAQLRPLFREARYGFPIIHCHVDLCCCCIRMMISEVLKIMKLENTAKRLKAASTSTSTWLKIIKPENIAERIKASKPSRTSSRITMEMMGSVQALLYRPDLLFQLVNVGNYPPELPEKLRYLQCFVTLTANRCIEHESMKDLFTHVEDVAYTTAHLCFLGLAYNMNSEFSKLLEKMSAFKPEVRQIYLSMLMGMKSSRSEKRMSWRKLRIFVDGVKEDLQKLLRNDDCLKVEFYDIMPWLQPGISYLSGFLLDIASKCTPLDDFYLLQSHIEALAIEAAIVIYSCYDEKMDKTIETDSVLFALPLKFYHVKLETDLIQLLHSKATILAPLEYLLVVQQELRFLGAFLMESLEQCKEKTHILTLIQSVTSQAWSFIHSPFRDSEQVEISCLYFQLALKFKFLKALIRQMCPTIYATTTLDPPTTNLLNFLPINFEVIDSYFSMLKFSRTSSSPEKGFLLMGFHEYVLDNLLTKCDSSTVADEVKMFYCGLLLLVTYFADPLVDGIGCSLSCDDAVGRNRSRMVNLVLQFLTETFNLVEIDGSLMGLLKQNHTLKAEILDLIERAHEELIFLGAFFIDALGQPADLNEVHDLLMHADVTVQKLAQISGSFYGSFMDVSSYEKMRLLLSDYLQEIESINVDVRKVWFQVLDVSPCHMTGVDGLVNFLLNHEDWFLNFDECPLSFLKNQIPVIKDKLVYLGSFLSDIVQYRDIHQELKALMKCIQDIKYVFLFPIRGYRPAWSYILCLSDVKKMLKFVEKEVRLICLKVPDSSSYSFPETNGLGFLDCFLVKLDELLCLKLDSVIELKHQIGSVREGLLSLRLLTDHFAGSYDEHDGVYSLITSVTEMAYKSEYVIDSCLTCSHPLWYKVLWISEVVENIKSLTKVVSETFKRKQIDATVPEVSKAFMNLSPPLSANTPRANEEAEGFHEAMGRIKKQLLGGSSQLDIISIVGMPGIGKTTLAEKIYNDLIVTHHFDVHAKCRVTQEYSWKELLLTILNDVLEPADRSEKEDGELANELRQVLLTKRFLMLIDDLWDKEAWDSLYLCFRDAQSRSRIILTTRLGEIANYAKCESNPHNLRLFTDDESWTLLQEEVFHGESCPRELGDVGFRIAKSCGGLPLFIVLVAGVLKEKKKKAEMWKEVEENLASQNIGRLEESMPLIGFSYKNLPHHLKPCFLYFGGFLKGKDINVSKLTRLWQVEGFVQANKEKRIEDAAQDFLEDLISRNLVLAMEKRPNDKVKRCRIHDLLHSFCLEKAKQEKFLNQINRFRGKNMFLQKPQDYRLFVHSYQDEIELLLPCRSNVRSLQFKVTDLDNLLWPRDVSFIFDNFKLVKVLDLESFHIGNTFPSEIATLIHLKYFAVQTDANSIPSCIAKLWTLETLVVRGLGGEVTLPSSLLKMVKLRHILVKDRASFNLLDNTDESLADSQLDNLDMFSTPHLTYEDAAAVLTKMPNLRKLSCIFSGTLSYSEKLKAKCVLFPRLEFLSHLESLKLVSNNYPAKLPHEFNFPSKLRELTLSKFRLPWSEISIIGELPNLEILKLLFRAFEGNLWEVNDSEFPQLKYLNLENLNISQWSVSDDAFPKLERLVLTKCNRLEEIPSQFGEAVSLKSIEVNRCGWSVSNSAQEIQKIQHQDMANDAFTVTIQSPDWDK